MPTPDTITVPQLARLVGTSGGPLLRDVATQGPWVSAHPDTILKMGTKEVLYRTRHLGWGTDTQLYCTVTEFDAAFPARLRSAGPRVLKQNRGNGGQGVWKVEALAGSDTLRVLEACRGSLPEGLSLAAFMARCRDYFARGGCIIDQPFQLRLPDGMIRCYVGMDRVVGFGHQLIQGADTAAAGGTGLACGATWPAHHARCVGRAVPGASRADGNRVGAADDAGARSRPWRAADHLGCGFSLWSS